MEEYISTYSMGKQILSHTLYSGVYINISPCHILLEYKINENKKHVFLINLSKCNPKTVSDTVIFNNHQN